MDKLKNKWPTWIRDDKSVVSCTEKIKVMKENFDELKQLSQDAIEDGLLMEVSEKQMKEALHQMVDDLINPYLKNKLVFYESNIKTRHATPTLPLHSHPLVCQKVPLL
jgi:hypothetical protein